MPEKWTVAQQYESWETWMQAKPMPPVPPPLGPISAALALAEAIQWAAVNVLTVTIEIPWAIACSTFKNPCPEIDPDENPRLGG